MKQNQNIKDDDQLEFETAFNIYIDKAHFSITAVCSTVDFLYTVVYTS